MSLSGVCQPADTDATGTVDAALPVGNTDEPNIPVTRGQNLTNPKRTTTPKSTAATQRCQICLFFSSLLLHILRFHLVLICLSLLFFSHLHSCLLSLFSSCLMFFSFLSHFVYSGLIYFISLLISYPLFSHLTSSHLCRPFNSCHCLSSFSSTPNICVSSVLFSILICLILVLLSKLSFFLFSS